MKPDWLLIIKEAFTYLAILGGIVLLVAIIIPFLVGCSQVQLRCVGDNQHVSCAINKPTR